MSSFLRRPRVVVASIALSALAVSFSAAQAPKPYAPGSSPQAGNPDPNSRREIDAHDSVFIEELTWLEVRDAIRAGKKTVIVPTSGVEQSGPYLATGKHSYVIRANSAAIARKLGDALVAPIVPFVPEGEFNPPSGPMRYPGTVGVSVDTFKRLLVDIATSCKVTGFERVVLIGDSGGNQKPMKDVAAELTAQWTDGRTRIAYIPEYYDYPGLSKYAESLGIREDDEGIHDNYVITAIMMVVDPTTVRMKQRIAKNRFVINTVPLAPAGKTIANGKKLIDFVATRTVAGIRKAFADPSRTER
jgi:creatinine amidohydrolase